MNEIENKQIKTTIDFSRLDVMRGITRDWTVEVIIQDFGIGLCTNCVVHRKDGMNSDESPIKKEKNRIMQVKFLFTNHPIYPIKNEEEQKYQDLLIKKRERHHWELSPRGTEPPQLTDDEKDYVEAWPDEKSGRAIMEKVAMEAPSYLCYNCANEYYYELLTCRDFIVGFRQKTKQLEEMQSLIEYYKPLF